MTAAKNMGGQTDKLFRCVRWHHPHIVSSDLDSGKKDRMLEIRVFDDSMVKHKSYYLQSSILKSASTFFANAIEAARSEQFVCEGRDIGQDDDLSEAIEIFIAGTIEAVEMLLYYCIKERLPMNDISEMKHEKACTILTEVWCLGGTHQMPELQDAAMLELLRILEGGSVQVDDIKFAFHNTPTDQSSPLRALLLDDFCWKFRHEMGLDYHKLRTFEDVEDFLVEFPEARDECETYHGDGFKSRIKCEGQGWRKYMVSDSDPKGHWIWEKMREQ